MAPTDSFDPRTWKEGDSASTVTPVTAVKPAAAAPVVQTVSGAKFRWWLGPALSAAIVAGGAFAAYETGADAPAVKPIPSAQ